MTYADAARQAKSYSEFLDIVVLPASMFSEQAYRLLRRNVNASDKSRSAS